MLTTQTSGKAKGQDRSQWHTYVRIQSFDHLLHTWHCLCDFYPFLFNGRYILYYAIQLQESRRIWQNSNPFRLCSPPQNLRYFLHSTNFSPIYLHCFYYIEKVGTLFSWVYFKSIKQNTSAKIEDWQAVLISLSNATGGFKNKFGQHTLATL